MQYRELVKLRRIHMKKIQNFVEKHIIIDYIGLLVLYLAFSKIPGLIGSIFSLDRNDIVVYNLPQAVYLLLFSIVLFIIIKKLNFAKGSRKHNLLICILLGFPFLIDSIGYLLKLSVLPQVVYKVSGLGILSLWFVILQWELRRKYNFED